MMKKPPALRLLMVTCQFMPEVYGGAEQQCLRQAVALQARGHKVTILTSRSRDETPGSEVMEGVPVIRHQTLLPPDLLGRYLPFSLLWVAKLVWFALRHREQFDVVHCHQGKFGVFGGAVVSRILGVPQVVKIGNSAPYMDLQALARKKVVGPLCLKFALANRPTFVAISSQIVKDLRDFGIPAKQIEMIVNTAVPVASEPAPLDTKQPKLFWHGRFEAIKNLPLLLQGVALATKKIPGLQLYLVGSGSREAMLREQAKELGIAKNVFFVAPPKKVGETIAQYDIFANTSFAEGMSNSMLEAMALGKALLTTPVSGAAEIITEGKNGFVVEATPAAVAEGIERTVALLAKGAKGVRAHNLELTATRFAPARFFI
jgi:glycosyltransferase involved in cell wall biosynthesis